MKKFASIVPMRKSLSQPLASTIRVLDVDGDTVVSTDSRQLADLVDHADVSGKPASAM